MACRYLAFYRGRQLEVEANTSYQAQLKAAEQFKAKRSADVIVMLTHRDDGTEVVHATTDL